MNIAEAKKVAAIVATAEGGCGGCCEQATADLNKQFPDFKWKLVEVKGFDHSIDVEEAPKGRWVRKWKRGEKPPEKYYVCTSTVSQAWRDWYAAQKGPASESKASDE